MPTAPWLRSRTTFDPFAPPPIPSADEIPAEIQAWSEGGQVVPPFPRVEDLPTWRSGIYTRAQWKRHIVQMAVYARRRQLQLKTLTTKEFAALHEYLNQ